MNKILLIVALGLCSVGCGGGGAYECSTVFKSFQSEIPVDCALLNRDIDVILTLLGEDYNAKGFPWNLSNRDDPMKDPFFKMTAIVPRSHLEEVAAKVEVSMKDGDSVECGGLAMAGGCHEGWPKNNITMIGHTWIIAHELMHAWEKRDINGALGQIRLGGHHQWDEKGYSAVVEQYGWADYWIAKINNREGSAVH